MEKKIIIVFVVFILVLGLGCFEEEPSNIPTDPVQKGDRLLGIAITEGSTNFEESFQIVKDVGAQFVELPLNWDDIEKSPQEYGNQFLSIANMYYPSTNTKVLLTINPVDTNVLHLPEDLANKNFDDPEVIERYNQLMDYVFSQIPDLDLVAVSIGNEIDAYLNEDPEKWEQYQRFFKETSKYIKDKGVTIGCKTTFDAAAKKNETEIKILNQYSDVIMVNYYPLNADFSVKDPSVVQSDFDTVVSLYPNKIIYITEAGYPSSPYVGSSEPMQKEFIKEIFKAWDTHKSHIKLIDFVWLHDLSTSQVDVFVRYYGVSAKNFREYLRTLGLRQYNGKEKEAFAALKKEAEIRGW
ncbi:MAG: glycosyl hydrolase 53 family protein [Candidatus Methanofastidiosia archaeon]|jgi:hypothetical protein